MPRHPKSTSVVSFFDRILSRERSFGTSGVKSLALEVAPSSTATPLTSFTEWDSCPSQAWELRLSRLVYTAWKQTVSYGLRDDTWVREHLQNILRFASTAKAVYELTRWNKPSWRADTTQWGSCFSRGSKCLKSGNHMWHIAQRELKIRRCVSMLVLQMAYDSDPGDLCVGIPSVSTHHRTSAII